VKILRIKLRNLNSLRGEHVVDFTCEPLKACGIFAITGPTGSGKSTLLDAMTLALYGKAARYENDRNPENMMSRHTSDCLAEVTFSVNQIEYRAEWQLRRARGKIDGKIQPPVRFLYDSSNKPLNRLATECDVEIERITGLDYPRFLRSVLLAQGEFSRFLKANAEERADLLESLTGTDIYTDLGKLAHEETARRDKELEAVKIALQQYQLLDKEEIATRHQAIHNDRTELTVLKKQLSHQQFRWQLAEQRQKSETALHNLAAQKATLDREATDHASDRERLRLHQSALPFSPSMLGYEHARTALKQCQLAFSHATNEANAAQHHHSHILQQTIAFSTQRIDALVSSRETIHQSLDHLDEQTRIIAEWLTANTHWQGLSDELSRLSERAHHLRNLHSLQHATHNQKQALQIDLEKNRLLLQQAHDALKLSQNTLAQKQQALQKANKSLQELCGTPSQTPDYLREQWHIQQQQTQRWLDALTHESALAESIRILEEKSRQAQKTHSEAKEQFSACQEILDACTQQERLRVDHFHLAERQASFAEHRAQLHDGTPCPLCGATEHPLAHAAEPSITLKYLRTAMECAQKDLRQAQQKNAKVQTAMIEAKAADHALKEQLETRHQELAASIRLRNEAGLTNATHETLQTRLQELANQQKQLNTTIESERSALLASSEADSRFQIAQQHSHNLQQGLEEKQSQAHQLFDTERERQQEIEASLKQLASAIAPFQLAMPDFSDEAFSLTAWETAAGHHPRALQKLAALQHERENRIAQQHQLDADLAHLQSRRDGWRSESQQHPLPTDTFTSPEWPSINDADQAHQLSLREFEQKTASTRLLQQQRDEAERKCSEAEQQILHELRDSPFADIETLRAALLSGDEEKRINAWQTDWQERHQANTIAIRQIQNELNALIESGAPSTDQSAALAETIQQTEQQVSTLQSRITLTQDSLHRDEQQRAEHTRKTADVAEQWRELELWQLLRQLIGSHDGAKFRKFAQSISLDILIHHANRHLRQLSERYRLQRQSESELTLEIIDLYQANTTRPMASLSGGETFIVSLALALGLSDLAGRNVQIDSLFIDEGFGTLDADALDTALSTLESLHQQNKTIGIISHIDLLKERIRNKINIRKLSAGHSAVEVV
jgi:DNA repair protein SbcC/Rad50